MKHPLGVSRVAACAAVVVLTILLQWSAVGADSGEDGKHLFILSGQSNMAMMPEEEFSSAVIREFGAENVLVIKDAKHGSSIMEWYKNWQPPENYTARDFSNVKKGRLYARLLGKVEKAIEGEKIQSVTFVWMQGERDARLALADVYEDSLRGVIRQLQLDLGREDVNVVIGRIDDFSMDNKKSPHWTRIRDIQVEFAESDPKMEWVDTDDLNGDKNDIHLVKPEGYSKLANRFANKAILMIKRDNG